VRQTFDRILSVVPVVLVPAAWTLAALAGHTTLVSSDALAVALGVMTGFFAVFVAHPEMRGPVLGAWRRVIAVGLVVTAVGLVDQLSPAVTPSHLAVVAVWLAAPVYGLAATGQALGLRRYRLFAAASFAGAALLVVSAAPAVPAVAGLAGLAVGGAGQTASIADAVWRQSRSA
jgi:hypothetical protein